MPYSVENCAGVVPRDIEFRAYQRTMIDFMLEHKRCGIWAGMGLGKSCATLTALDALFLSGEETRPALVVAPLRVAQSTWPDEAAKWSHLRGIEVKHIAGTDSERMRILQCSHAAVFTINYELLPWLIDYYLQRIRKPFPFGTVIADESTKLKGFRLRQGTARARSLAKVAHTHATRWVNLTGTPAPNGLQDLWGQTWFIDQGQRLGRTFDGFKQRWFRPSHNGFGSEPLQHAQEDIEEKLCDICLSLDARDHFDLSAPIVNVIKVELPDRARRLYEDMEKRMFMEIEGRDVEAFNAASRTIKCLQICNGAAYVGEDSSEWAEVHDAKLQALEDVIEEAAGMPVLVAYHFKSDLARLQKAFKKGRHLDQDPQTIRDWNAGRIPILFAHPASAGHGLNLQDGGNILAFFGLWWNLEEHQQIIERIGPTRQAQAGHDRPVFIHHIVAADTVDEIVLDRINTKREVQDLLLEAMKKGRR